MLHTSYPHLAAASNLVVKKGMEHRNGDPPWYCVRSLLKSCFSGVIAKDSLVLKIAAFLLSHMAICTVGQLPNVAMRLDSV